MWDRAKKIAKAMLDGQLWLPEVAKSTHYHAYWVRPSWVSEMKKMYKFGVHTFYRPRAWGDGSEAPSWGTPAQTAEISAELAGSQREEFGRAVRESTRAALAARRSSAAVPITSAPGARSRFATLPCKTVLQAYRRLGFSCECINSPQCAARSRVRFGAKHRGICMTAMQATFARPPRRRLADAAGDHRLRLRDRAVELRPSLEPRLFHSADEPRICLGPRRLRPRARRSKPVVGARPAVRRRDRRPLRRLARDVRRRAALCRRPA